MWFTVSFAERIGDNSFIYQRDTMLRTKQWANQKDVYGFNTASLFPGFESHRKSSGKIWEKSYCINSGRYNRISELSKVVNEP